MMMPSIFGAEQRISEPLSALAVQTGRHTEKIHPRPCFSQKSTSQRNQRVNDIASGLLRVFYDSLLIITYIISYYHVPHQ